VPFCINFIPGIIGLVAWIISQLLSMEVSISLFSVWSQIVGFFVAKLVAWWLVDLEGWIFEGGAGKRWGKFWSNYGVVWG
jgi:hypothetical protein